MDLELQMALKRKYPLFLKGLFDNIAAPKEPISMFGIECGEGWFGIIDELGSKIEPLIKKFITANTEECGPGIPHVFDPTGFPRALQIKEKFAQIRIYMSATEEMYKYITEAEEKSATVCETCGKPGKTRGKNWVYTACEECCHERDRTIKNADITFNR